MTTFLATIPLWAVFAWYVGHLFQWWPVLDDPEHFNRLQIEEDDKVRWAKALNVGLRSVVVRHGE